MAADPIVYTPTLQYLKARRGNPVFGLHDIFNNIAVSKWEDDFMGDLFKGGAAPGAYQSTASGAASATAAIVAGTVNGAILLDAGTDNSGRSDLSLGRHFRGDLNATLIVRASIDTITTSKFEVGFTDVISGTDAGAVNVKATPSFTADDFVGLVRDTNDDTNVTLLGVAATVAAAAIDMTTTIAAATYYYYGVTLRDTNAKGFILDANGNLIEQTAWMANAVTGTVLLTPWIFFQNRSAAAHAMTVDYLLAYQRRTTG